jgi:hypothetical protein
VATYSSRTTSSPAAPATDKALAALTSPGIRLDAPVQIPNHRIQLLPAPNNFHPNVPAATALANPVVRGMLRSNSGASPGIKLGVLHDKDIRHVKADGSSTLLYDGTVVWAVAGTVLSEPSGPSSTPGPHGETADGTEGPSMANLVVFLNAVTGRFLFAVEGEW